MDPTWNQIAVAAERAGGPAYVRAGAAELPFADGSFDAAVACLVFEHIDDVHGAIDEIARVVRPGGRFSFFLNHPLLQTPGSGWISDYTLDPPESYWRIGPYLVEQDSVEQVERGVFIRFIHRPLSTYINALGEAGLVLERMVEPAPPDGFLERAAGVRGGVGDPAPAVPPPAPDLTLGSYPAPTPNEPMCPPRSGAVVSRRVNSWLTSS